jgi:hypothetical protein
VVSAPADINLKLSSPYLVDNFHAQKLTGNATHPRRSQGCAFQNPCKVKPRCANLRPYEKMGLGETQTRNIVPNMHL